MCIPGSSRAISACWGERRLRTMPGRHSSEFRGALDGVQNLLVVSHRLVDWSFAALVVTLASLSFHASGNLLPSCRVQTIFVRQKELSSSGKSSIFMKIKPITRPTSEF